MIRLTHLILISAMVASAMSLPAQETEQPNEPAEPIMVAIVWHQHQPHYLRDPETGEFAWPWVRLHAVKDYVDMVTTLDEYPNVHTTFNVTPVLINQIDQMVEAWDAGRPTDRFVRLTLTDPAEMSDEDKAFVLRNFFSLNWDRMLQRHERYMELRDMRPGVEDAQITQAIATFTDQDFRDLQMLFNLAWMDPDFWEGLMLPNGEMLSVGHWIEQGRDFSEDDKRALMNTHFEIMRQVIPVHRAAQDRGQIEVTTTPYYHPILPLLIDTNSALEAVPDMTLPTQRFQRPDDAALHVQRAVEQYQNLFGQAPIGMWPAEGSVSQAAVPLLADAGIRWFATDVQVLLRSLGVDDAPARQRFTMWQVNNPGGQPVAGIFRDTGLSDRIGFTYSGWNGSEAAEDFVGILHSIRNVVAAETERPLSQCVIPIILDGENCWESYENDGKEFLHTLYGLLNEDPLLDTVTVAECLERSGDLPVIERLHAGSWISANFETWIGEPEENRAWDLLSEARAALDTVDFDDETARQAALELLLIAEGSDWFWWYGSDQHIDNEESFDEVFRGTLLQAYCAMGLEPPDILNEPIMTGAGAAEGSGGVMAVGE